MWGWGQARLQGEGQGATFLICISWVRHGGGGNNQKKKLWPLPWVAAGMEGVVRHVECAMS